MGEKRRPTIDLDYGTKNGHYIYATIWPNGKAKYYGIDYTTDEWKAIKMPKYVRNDIDAIRKALGYEEEDT